MAIRKFGAPATSHVRYITAEDVEVLATASEELSKTENDVKPKKSSKKDKEQREDSSTTDK